MFPEVRGSLASIPSRSAPGRFTSFSIAVEPMGRRKAGPISPEVLLYRPIRRQAVPNEMYQAAFGAWRAAPYTVPFHPAAGGWNHSSRCAYRCTLKRGDCLGPGEAEANVEKHGVRFGDAVSVLEDPRAITIDDYESSPEERFVTLGLDALARVLVVVYAWSGGDVRLISARLANPHERQEYENQ